MTDAFLEAVKAGDGAKVRELLTKDPALKDARTKEGVHPAVLALYYGHGDVAKAILATRPVLDLHAAATVGDGKRVRELVEHDPASVGSYSPDGFPALALAAFMGHRDIVAYLLDRGADVNQMGRNPGKFTALTGAVSNRHVEVVGQLLEAGANPNYWYQDGFTPVLGAAAHGDIPMLERLVAHGGDVTAETVKGKTAVALALEGGHAAAATWLREHGAPG